MVENILKSSLDLMAEGDMPPGKKKTLEAAIILFGKKGYNGTSTLEIAKAAGVSQATVFKYFRTKEDLLISIIVPILPRLFSNFLGRVKNINTITVKEIIHYIVRDRFRFMKENKDIIKIIFSEVLTNEQLKQKIIIGAEEVFKERRLDEFFEYLKQNNPEINKELTLPEIMRSIAGALITYFIQRFIVFDEVICETEEHDLDVIERQIYNCWTI
ncbi:TetR family transcriptional regulator [Gemella morbillorum]|uniref:TetR family transcriptional regulator n=1 Tax=Gemella morbillorum TaxID=29391 RepID=UPI0035655CB7